MQENTSNIRPEQCPECGSTRLIKFGKVWSGRTKVQRWQCKDCGRIVTVPLS